MVFVRFLSDSANADSINTHTVSETPSPTQAGRVMADGPSWGAACTPKEPSSKTASMWVLIKKMSHQEHALWRRRSQNGAMRYLSVVVVMLMAVMPGQHDWP